MQHESSSQPVAGIDVSKSTLDCFIDVIDKSFSVVNDQSGIASLIEQLRAANVRLVLIEATGRYHRRCAAELERYLKSGSGHAFAKRHLWPNHSTSD